MKKKKFQCNNLIQQLSYVEPMAPDKRTRGFYSIQIGRFFSWDILRKKLHDPRPTFIPPFRTWNWPINHNAGQGWAVSFCFGRNRRKDKAWWGQVAEPRLRASSLPVFLISGHGSRHSVQTLAENTFLQIFLLELLLQYFFTMGFLKCFFSMCFLK